MATLASLLLVAALAVAVTFRRRRAAERERIEQQLEYILAIPSADYRLRMLGRHAG